MRIYKVAELKAMPIGTTFIHEILGKCRISSNGTTTFMEFDSTGLVPSGFIVDGYPWSVPMELIATEEEKLEIDYYSVLSK